MSSQKLVPFAVAAFAIIGYVGFLRGDDGQGQKARQLVENGALLLDVRTPEEFAAGHIAGAVNIPVQDLERRISELGEKDRPIVVYCRSGNRSRHAVRMLASKGYATLHDLGPMSRW